MKKSRRRCYTLRTPRGNRRRIVAANLEDQLIDKVRALPPNKQQEALRLLDILATGAAEPNGIGVDRRPIWEIVEEINAELPADTWDKVPTDGSINLDH